MNTTVSARIPAEIKKRGDSKLREIGSSATELINAAYCYVIEHGELPTNTPRSCANEPQVKTLSGDAAESFKGQWASNAVLEAAAYDGNNFKELLGQARENRYARLA